MNKSFDNQQDAINFASVNGGNVRYSEVFEEWVVEQPIVVITPDLPTLPEPFEGEMFIHFDKSFYFSGGEWMEISHRYPHGGHVVNDPRF